MKAIFFSGRAGGGKTANALGIGMKLQEEGLKISYCKPFGFRRGSVKKEDDDVLLMREVFKLPFSSEIISPVTATGQYLAGMFLQEDNTILKKIEQSYETCRQGYDVILIDGSVAPYVGFNQGLDDFSLAERWGAAVIHVIKAVDDFDFDQSLLHLELWSCRKVSVLGCIFNNISRAQWDKTRGIYWPILERRNIRVLGAIPSRLEIAAPTVAEFYNALQGEVLAAPDRMNRLVEEVVIGTMTIESALGYLRRAPNKALITGGDRSDLALTALETSTSVIIFTGGLYPDVRVLSRAEEKGVPVILVHMDTYTTVENLHSVYRSIHPRNTEAIRIVRENVDRYIDWRPVLDYVRG